MKVKLPFTTAVVSAASLAHALPVPAASADLIVREVASSMLVNLNHVNRGDMSGLNNAASSQPDTALLEARTLDGAVDAMAKAAVDAATGIGSSRASSSATPIAAKKVDFIPVRPINVFEEAAPKPPTVSMRTSKVPPYLYPNFIRHFADVDHLTEEGKLLKPEAAKAADAKELLQELADDLRLERHYADRQSRGTKQPRERSKLRMQKKNLLRKKQVVRYAGKWLQQKSLRDQIVQNLRTQSEIEADGLVEANKAKDALAAEMLEQETQSGYEKRAKKSKFLPF